MKTHLDPDALVQQRRVDLEVLRRIALVRRNADNRARYNARRAWLEHNNEPPRDHRTPKLRVRFKLLPVLRYFEDGEDSYFERRWITSPTTCGITTYDGRAWLDLGSRPIKRVGEIEAEYTRADCDPCDWRERERCGLALGIGDAPGTARVIE